MSNSLFDAVFFTYNTYEIIVSICSADFEFALHQRRQRVEQAASVALAESTVTASVAVPPPEEEPMMMDDDIHHQCTSHGESISLPTCSNDTVSSPRSQETMQGCGSYSCEFFLGLAEKKDEFINFC